MECNKIRIILFINIFPIRTF